MKSAGKARNNGLYRHIRTSKEIIRNLLNDLDKYWGQAYRLTPFYGIPEISRPQLQSIKNCLQKLTTVSATYFPANFELWYVLSIIPSRASSSFPESFKRDIPS